MEEEEEKRLRLEQELGVRELTPEEIRGIFDKNKELEDLVRQRYPDYFASPSQQPEV